GPLEKNPGAGGAAPGFQAQSQNAPSPPSGGRRRGVLALGLETGRGHRRARIFDHRHQGGTAWGRC
ncbi:hypothetical protein EOL30_26425, partial [Citrobacter freundii]